MSFGVALAIHGLLLAGGIYYMVRYAAPRMHLQSGDGIPPGDPGEMIEAQAGPGEVPLPLSSFIEDASSASNTGSLADSEPAVTIPQEFETAPEFDKGYATEYPVLFGMTSDSFPMEAPTRRAGAQNTNQPSAADLHAGTAHAQAEQTATNVGSDHGGARGKSHVWTGVRPAGNGGAHGHGGSRGGIDTCGWPQPEYPPESLRYGEEGTIKLKVEFRADGKVGQVTVLSDDGHPRLAAAAVASARQYQFDPATIDGQPTTVTYEVPFVFSIKNKNR